MSVEASTWTNALVFQLLKPEAYRARVVSSLFQYFKVEQVTANLFESPQYQQWSELILRCLPRPSSTAHELIFSQLMAHYDRQLPKLLIKAKQVKVTKNIAEHYESMLLSYCISDSIEKGIGNNLLLQWYKKMPDASKYFAVIELRLRLEENKVDLYSIKAINSKDAEGLLTKLLALKPHELEFGRQRLHKAVTTKDLLANSNFEYWKYFVESMLHLNFGEVLLSTLGERALSDRHLLDDLYALSDDMKKLWSGVPDALINEWTDYNNGLAEILHKLEFDKHDGQFLKSPVVDIFERYLVATNFHDEDVELLIITWLSNRPGKPRDIIQCGWLRSWLKFKKAANVRAPLFTMLSELYDRAQDLRSAVLSREIANIRGQLLRLELLD